MCTALVSCLTGNPVRADVAMTGEITLRGLVLPIGGLKEKLLAAHRGGIKVVLIPDDNKRDLEEIPDNVIADLEIHPVKRIDDVLAIALEHPAFGAQPVAPNSDGSQEVLIKLMLVSEILLASYFCAAKLVRLSGKF